VLTKVSKEYADISYNISNDKDDEDDEDDDDDDDSQKKEGAGARRSSRYEETKAAAASAGVQRQAKQAELMKKKIAARGRWTCRRCKKTVDHTYEIDHICPRSRGGSDAPANLRLLCRACHGYITAEQRLASK
jgi:5-methylcytosine-specific restriction endonuclease McrA